MTSYHEALHTILENVEPLAITSVKTDGAGGLYLAEEILAPADSPSFDDSAVDGYAVISSETPGTLRLAGAVYAGDDPARLSCASGSCVKTMTGAGIAPGADAVVMQEDTSSNGESVEVKKKVSHGANVRKHGSEFHVGDLVLHKGTHLNAASLSLAGSLGLVELPVYTPPRVGILVTGEELVAPGGKLQPGQRFESNSIALSELASGITGRAPLTLRVGDDEKETKAAVERLLSECDVLVTSGGASVGEKDLVRGALKECGAEELFWRVSIKPGKPVSFSVAPSGCRVFALPGNPVSAIVTFEVLVAPAIRKMVGAPVPGPEFEPITLARAQSRDHARLEFVRAITENIGGKLMALPLAKQGSNMVTSVSRADRLLLIEPGDGDVEAGTLVESVALRWAQR